MNPPIADRAQPVIHYALALHARLQSGERPILETEQAALKGLLLSNLEAKRWGDYGGETELSPAVASGRLAAEKPRHGSDPFLGVRYALVCWLDELFILDSPYSAAWNEKKLEAALYGTNDRAWKFWEQAQLAELRPGTDSLEVFFLCVMLGFRGELREQPDKLRDWVTATRLRILQGQQQEWDAPAELAPRTDVPPRHGRDRLRRMVRIAGWMLMLLIPLVTFLVVQKIGH